MGIYNNELIGVKDIDRSRVFCRDRFKFIDGEGVLMDVVRECPGSLSGNDPLIIILHGLTGYKEEAHLQALSRMAQEIGFVSLRADLYGHGETNGSFYSHTLLNWTDEIIKLTDSAREKGCYSKIFLCGHSQGALCALLAASRKRENADGVIALAPALKIPDQARAGTLFGLKFDPDRIPEEISVWGKPLSGNYIRAAQSVLPNDITAFDGPVLFVHSDTDERVPVAVSKEAVKQYRHAELIVTHGDTHDFDLHPESMTDAVRTWLLRQ